MTESRKIKPGVLVVIPSGTYYSNFDLGDPECRALHKDFVVEVLMTFETMIVTKVREEKISGVLVKSGKNIVVGLIAKERIDEMLEVVEV